MTDLSVVIVSYNVRAFLEQCLVSVERAAKGLDVEVWVVDNKSVDGSVDMVKRRFPWVKLIANEDNVGFSVANNQAIRKSSGKHVLLLNPDTVVREDTFAKGLEHMEAHPNVGGMGVPMYDGTGQYLPESKRGLPTPWVAFCRMAGLHRFAPTSEKFNAYYAGHLGERDTGPVDILAGAYMWMRKEALDEVGLLDEQFFMYGEDIDLSWRLVLGGWENHYCANTSIIHYKGESTKKGSLNYVMVFYNAMLLFAAKHYEGRQARAFSWMIRVAIYGRAALAVVRRVLSRWGDLIRVAVLTLVAFGAWLWALDGLGERQFNWPDVVWQGGLLWVLQTAALTMFGGQAEPSRLHSRFRPWSAWVAASSLTIIVYSLWPEDWRFSRSGVLGLVLFQGAIHAAVAHRRWKRSGNPRMIRRVLVAAQDLPAVVDLLRKTEGVQQKQQAHALWAHETLDPDMARPSIQAIPWVGTVRDLSDALQIHNVQEVVFSGRDVTADHIVKALPELGKRGVHCRIAWTDAGDLMASGGAARPSFVDFQRGLHRPEMALAKRRFDVTSAALMLLLAPGLAMLGRLAWVGQAWHVLWGSKTWVSPGSLDMEKPHVLDLKDGLGDRAAQRKSFTHTQDYHWKKDLSVVVDALFSRRAIISHGHH
ncbi:MAG: glycosyltransferase [Flavobacteriales bacterium]